MRLYLQILGAVSSLGLSLAFLIWGMSKFAEKESFSISGALIIFAGIVLFSGFIYSLVTIAPYRG